MDFRIIHHHVGARGNVPLPLDHNSPIREDFSVYYYDADPDALTDHLQSLIRVGDTNLLPHCIGAKRERRDFHLAKDRFSSSLYRLNPDYADYTKAGDLGQLTMGVSHAVESVVEVDVAPLDEVCGPDRDIAPPDYLSIDVEGAELDILRGAANVLAANVLWLRSEMWIHPVYQDAPTFATSLAWLQDRGFDFHRLEPYDRYEADQLTLGMHAGGQTLGAEVWFHRRLKDLEAEAERSGTESGTDVVLLKLYKFALLAVLYGGNGLGLRALKCAHRLGGTFFAEAGGRVPAHYLDFLRELWGHFQRMAGFLPVLPDLSAEIQARRQRQFAHASATDEATKQSILEEDNAARRDIANRLSADLERVHRLNWAGHSALEGCLRKYGLSAQARAVQDQRKAHCETFILKYYLLCEPGFR